MITKDLIGVAMALTENFKDFSTGDLGQDKLQLNLKKYFAQFNDLIFLNGRLISEQLISTSSTKIEHKLGRQPLGWFLVDKVDQGDVWRVSWDDKHITFDTSSNATISFWIF